MPLLRQFVRVYEYIYRTCRITVRMARAAPTTGPVDYLCDPVREQCFVLFLQTDREILTLLRALAGTKIFYGKDWKLRLNPVSDTLIKPILPLSLMAFFESLKEKVSAAKGKLLVAVSLGSVTLVQYASATSINDSVSPILTDVANLMSPLLTLVLAALPIMIALAVIGFILGLLSSIIGKIRIS
jgi:hypothetical protein